MPHIIVKIALGKIQEEKHKPAAKISKSAVDVINAREEFVAVSLKYITPADLKEKVYKPNILAHCDKLYKDPNCNRD